MERGPRDDRVPLTWGRRQDGIPRGTRGLRRPRPSSWLAVLVATLVGQLAAAGPSCGPLLEEAHLVASDGAFADQLGRVVALQGHEAFIGAHWDDTPFRADSGSVRVFVRSPGTRSWTEQQALFGSDAAAFNEFGFSLAVDGNTLLVGAREPRPAGSVHVFVRDLAASAWTEQTILVPPVPEGTTGPLALSVGISGDTAVIGHDGVVVDGLAEAGAAYVYQRSGASWALQAMLTDPTPVFRGRFAIAVAIDGDSIAVASRSDLVEGIDSGSAQVFIRCEAAWTHQATLVADDRALRRNAFSAVALDGDILVAGARHHLHGIVETGGAWVFARQDGVWTQEAEIRGSQLFGLDDFGAYVALEGGRLVVTADSSNIAHVDAGAVFVFDRLDSGWTETALLTADDAAPSDRFGNPAISGDTILVGVRLDDTLAGTDTGAAYVYRCVEQNCADGLDDDADGRIDCEDADCCLAPACFGLPESSCCDGTDDDCDGLIDRDDPDCFGLPACIETDCTDGLDEDADGSTDCADLDCQGHPDCRSENCENGVDDDGDGCVDCADSECSGLPACLAEDCANGLDDDEDGCADALDADCGGMETACFDGVDDDCDGCADGADSDCGGMETACTDGVDDDCDGLVDCEDTDCVGPVETRCGDGCDDDRDGCADALDSDCGGIESDCADGLDDDCDGLADCADPDCSCDVLACPAADCDEDAIPNDADCAPEAPGSWSVPAEPTLLAWRAGPTAELSWTDLAATAGPGTRYEVASSSFAWLLALRQASPPCVAGPLEATAWTDPRMDAESYYYLVRAVNDCGPPGGTGWGTDSLGGPRPSCP